MNLRELYEIEQKLVCISLDIDKIGREGHDDKDATETKVYNHFWELRKSIQQLIAETHFRNDSLADSRWRNSRRHWS